MRHIRCIELRDVERFKFYTGSKHIAHIFHVLSIQILNTFNFGQRGTLIEPPITARWSCICKRSIEDHLLDIFSLGIPARIVIPHIKIISSFGLDSLVAESKSFSGIIKLGISTSRSKVTSRAAVGIGVVDFATIIAFEVCAATEHIRTNSNLVRFKIIASVDGCES